MVLALKEHIKCGCRLPSNVQDRNSSLLGVSPAYYAQGFLHNLLKLRDATPSLGVDMAVTRLLRLGLGAAVGFERNPAEAKLWLDHLRPRNEGQAGDRCLIAFLPIQNL